MLCTITAMFSRRSPPKAQRQRESSGPRTDEGGISFRNSLPRWRARQMQPPSRPVDEMTALVKNDCRARSGIFQRMVPYGTFLWDFLYPCLVRPRGGRLSHFSYFIHLYYALLPLYFRIAPCRPKEERPVPLPVSSLPDERAGSMDQRSSLSPPSPRPAAPRLRGAAAL